MNQLITYNLQEAATRTGLTKETIRAALNDGSLAGRLIGGKKGWITTDSALRCWIEGGNQETEKEDEND